jgi:hypothetical protein
MQVLQLKKRDQEGREVTVGVKVLRSWQDGSGRQLYLHANGVYGYKDGAPVRTKAELDVIGSGVQREMARRWWDSTGKQMSEKHYKAVEDAERARMADFVIDDRAEQTERDQVLYRCRPKGGTKKDWTEPFAWMEKFEARPDWWGQAETIVLRGFEYEQADIAAADVTGSMAANEV